MGSAHLTQNREWWSSLADETPELVVTTRGPQTMCANLPNTVMYAPFCSELVYELHTEYHKISYIFFQQLYFLAFPTWQRFGHCGIFTLSVWKVIDWNRDTSPQYVDLFTSFCGSEFIFCFNVTKGDEPTLFETGLHFPLFPALGRSVHAGKFLSRFSLYIF